MQRGEIRCFDTDLIGPYGYCADISRAWTVGHVAPTAEQRKLYRLAHEQVQHNMALLRPGLGHREFVERSWDIPEALPAQPLLLRGPWRRPSLLLASTAA